MLDGGCGASQIPGLLLEVPLGRLRVGGASVEPEPVAKTSAFAGRSPESFAVRGCRIVELCEPAWDLFLLPVGFTLGSIEVVFVLIPDPLGQHGEIGDGGSEIRCSSRRETPRRLRFRDGSGRWLRPLSQPC